MSISNRLPRLAPSPTFLLITVSLLTAAGLLFLTDSYPTNPDALAFIQASQQLVAGEGLSQSDPLNRQVSPFFYMHGFRILKAGAVKAWLGSPPGFGLLLALAGVVVGSAGVYYFTPLLASLIIPATYFLGRVSGQERWTALLSALLMAASAAFWRFGSAPWSDGPNLLFIGTGAAFFLLSRSEACRPRRCAWYALLAAVLIGYSLFIRFANALVIVPILLGFDLVAFIRTRQPFIAWLHPRWLTYAILALFVAGVFAYNTTYFGGPLNSVYNTPELGAYPWPLFSPGYALGPSPFGGYSLWGTAATLWDNYSFLLLLAPLGWLTMRRPAVLLIFGVPLLTAILYSVYAFDPTGVNARFLLPMFPFLAVAIASCIHHIWVRLSRKEARFLAAPMLALILLWLWLPVLPELAERNRAHRNNVAYIRALVAEAPADAVWISSAQNDLIHFYGERSTFNYRRALQADPGTGEFDVANMEQCVIHTVDRLLEENRPVYFIYETGWSINHILETHYTLQPAGVGGQFLQVASAPLPRSEPARCTFRFPLH